MKNLSGYFDKNKFFKFFDEISKIPRGSGNCSHIADYLVSFANSRGLEVFRDSFDNVLIKKAATVMGSTKTVILQGHTDIVSQKVEGLSKDLMKEGLDIYVDGDFIKARGTTLGGDDGIAVAYALAILDSGDIPHPNIEALFTSDEEIGLIGASGFDKSKLFGKMMINIDSDDEGIFTVGCAGGVRTDAILSVKRENFSGFGYTLKISGLLGGHSGVEIDKNRANAIKVGFEALSSLENIRLVSLGGGSADNAIPSSFFADFISDKNLLDSFGNLKEILIKKYRDNDPDINITLSESEFSKAPLTLESTLGITDMVCKYPNGVISFSKDIPGLVETSLNAGICELTDDSFKLCASVRSSKNSEKAAVVKKLSEIAASHGADFSTRGDYPGWEFCKNSKLQEVFAKAYRDMFTKEAKFVTIHAGLECGIFADAIEGFDCISLGPDNFDIHTTDERLSISSSIRVYELLLSVLERLTH